ncbi:MAG: hypothetical protein QXW38_08380 [Candidatus Nitrosotenuis sp.]
MFSGSFSGKSFSKSPLTPLSFIPGKYSAMLGIYLVSSFGFSLGSKGEPPQTGHKVFAPFKPVLLQVLQPSLFFSLAIYFSSVCKSFRDFLLQSEQTLLLLLPSVPGAACSCSKISVSFPQDSQFMFIPNSE